MKDAYYYLYETTNLTNKRKYIGQHCTYDMNDGYYGTSKELKEDIKSGHNYKVNIKKAWDSGIRKITSNDLKRIDNLHKTNIGKKRNEEFILKRKEKSLLS